MKTKYKKHFGREKAACGAAYVNYLTRNWKEVTCRRCRHASPNEAQYRAAGYAAEHTRLRKLLRGGAVVFGR